MEPIVTYITLFVTSLFAATIIPAQSEALLFGLLSLNTYPIWALLIVASTGNILGSCMNWLLGRAFWKLEDRAWFPIKRANLVQAQSWYHRYGRWSLLLSWLPIIGDPLTVVAGVLREPFPIFLALVTFAKVGRYLAIIIIQQELF